METLFFALLTFFIVVAVHEGGHFLLARWCGIRVLRFSLGFGPPLLSWRDRQGTRFMLSWIPLGGYVQMLQADDSLPGLLQSGSFDRSPLISRVLVILAGPAFNVLLAILIFWGLHLVATPGIVPVVDQVRTDSPAELAGLEPGWRITGVDGRPVADVAALHLALVHRMGESGTIDLQLQALDDERQTRVQVPVQQWLAAATPQDPLTELGVQLYHPAPLPVVDRVLKGGAAQQAGLRRGDRLLEADGQALEDWQQWVSYVQERPGQPIVVRIRRADQVLTVEMVPRPQQLEDGRQEGRVGIVAQTAPWPPELLHHRRPGPVQALGGALRQSWELSALILDGLVKMATALISPRHLGGPLTIADVATSSADHGLRAYLAFLALLSLSLAVLNLLPVPLLDGGQLVFQVTEGMIGRPIPDTAKRLAHGLGLVLILGVLVLAVYNDLARYVPMLMGTDGGLR